MVILIWSSIYLEEYSDKTDAYSEENAAALTQKECCDLIDAIVHLLSQ